jgi:hypothetical protein
VIRDDLALARAHHALLLEAGDQPIDRLVEVLHHHRLTVAPRREQRRFVDEIGEIGAGKARGSGRDLAQFHGGVQLDVAHVNLQDFSRPLTSGLSTSTCRSNRPGRISAESSTSGRLGRRHDDDRLARVEAVHLREQLIECLLAFFVAAHRALHTRLAERIELVDEDDARGLGLGLGEQIADARRADADEHLDELRSAQAEEGHLGLAGNRASQQRLAGARRADRAARPSGSFRQVRELARGLQELDDSRSSCAASSTPATSAKRRLDVVLRVDLRLAARERHHAAFGAAEPPREERPRRDDQHEGQQPADDLGQPAADDLTGVTSRSPRRALRQASDPRCASS